MEGCGDPSLFLEAKRGPREKKSLGITARDYCVVMTVAEILCCMLWNGRFSSIQLFNCCYQAALWKGLLISNLHLSNGMALYRTRKLF